VVRFWPHFPGEYRMRARSILVPFCLAVSAASSASADPPAGTPAAPSAAAPAEGKAKPDPKARAGTSPYNQTIQKGNVAYTTRDFQGAIGAYREAVQANPKDPMGYYMLGEAQLAAGSVAEADAAWNAGLTNAGDNDTVRAKLLFVLADLRERQGRWEDAKKAWDEYAQFCAGHPKAKGYTATATERKKMLEQRDDVAKKAEAVKQRIETRLKENGAPPPDTGPQGPGKKK
jgi:tetratricopeptide (TPR) repeat protein